MSNLESASLVRPGDKWTLARLTRLGGKVLERGQRQDSDGTVWPYALVRLGQRRVLVVLGTTACNDGAA